MSHSTTDHLSAEQMQAFLDGEMPRKALSAAEEHLAACARCSAELEAWRALFQDLDQLSPAHRPHEGFHARVMAGVDISERRSLAERLRDRLAAAFGDDAGSHVPGNVLQDFLDGALATRRARRIEEHLGRCSTCTGEADAWLRVMRRLDGLGSFAPADDFADAVMARVRIPEPVPLTARIRKGLEAVLGTSPVPEHVPSGVLQDFVDDTLPTTAMARVGAHVDECGRCADELASWRGVMARLGSVERLEPTEGFTEAVMAGLREVRAVEAAARPAPAWRRALATARRAAANLIPETRQAVAALSGAAVTPMVVLGVAFWTLYTHPTLTLGSLLSFAAWQLGDLTGAALAAVSGAVTGSAEVFGLYSLLETVASAPVLVALGAVAYTMVCSLALRVLYRNLFANRPSRARYAHVSTAS